GTKVNCATSRILTPLITWVMRFSASVAHTGSGKWLLCDRWRCEHFETPYNSGCAMNRLRLACIAGAFAAAMSSAAPADQTDAAADRTGVHGFDFEFGDWKVHHRIKRPTGEWVEFDGTCVMRPLMAGAANREEHTFNRSTGTTYGFALRSYDVE